MCDSGWEVTHPTLFYRVGRGRVGERDRFGQVVRCGVGVDERDGLLLDGLVTQFGVEQMWRNGWG